MKTIKKRAGLYLFNEYSSANPDEVTAVVGRGWPSERLAQVQEQAKAYPSVRRLHEEIKWIEDHINMLRLEQVVSYALTAVERGLMLLDTQRHLRAVIKHGDISAGGRVGAATTNEAKKGNALNKTKRAAKLFKHYDELNPKWSAARIKDEIVNKHGFSLRNLDEHLKVARSQTWLPARRQKATRKN